MISKFNYNKETKSFSFYTSTIKAGKYAGAAAAGLGLISAGIGVKKSLENPKFSVVALGSNGPQAVTVKAESPIQAITKAKLKIKNGSRFKAFRLPDQDDQSQEYYDSLNK